MQSTGKFEIMEGSPSNQASGSRLLMILVAVCALIAVIAVIIAAVALSRPASPNITVQNGQNGGSSSNGAASAQTSSAASTGAGSSSWGSTGTSCSTNKIYTIAVGHDYGAHEYIDTSGYLAGFHHEVIDAVCTEAGMDCRTVWDKYNNCWDSTPGQPSHGGKGLMGGWYDACTGWYTTIDRIQVYTFSQPWLTPTMSAFYVKSSSSYDPGASGVANKKIGFLDGWASDEKCLNRWNTIQGKDSMQVVHLTMPDEILDALNQNRIDALFAAYTDVEPYLKDGIKQVAGSSFSCMVAGNAMMTRKDSDFVAKWNIGFSKLVSSGKFRKMCQKASQDHSARGNINCVEG